MALSCNNQLDLYSGGPSRQKQRGFVTVSEPALGFFITGTNIGPACGIYVAVRTDAIKKIDPAHKVLLAYRNDSAPHWGMALVEPRDAQKKREIKKSKRQRQRSQWGHFGYEDDEDSDEEDLDGVREWVFVDPDGRDRFSHKGDTIIPGAGTSWKHLHRAVPKVPKNKAMGDDSDSDEEEIAAEEEESFESAEEAPAKTTAIQEAKDDDEDELPWQVIAILDRETVRDMRYTQRCYDANLVQAKSGKRLPKPALTGIDHQRLAGSWLYRIAASGGVPVRVSPTEQAPVIGYREKDEYLQVVERCDGEWLRLYDQDAANHAGGMLHRRFFGEDHWLHIGKSADHPDVVEIKEQDLPNMSTELPEEQEEADVFDKPFEPMLGDGKVDEADVDMEAAGEEEAEKGRSSAHEVADVDMEAAGEEEAEKERIRKLLNSSKYQVVCLPEPEEEYPLGAEVGVEGLGNAKFNGRVGTICTELTEDGRQGVQLEMNGEFDGEKISVKINNIRALIADENGRLGRFSRVLGITLKMLGIKEQGAGNGARTDGETAGENDPTTTAEEQDTPQKSKSAVPKELAYEILGAAYRSSQRDLALEATSAHEDIQTAFDGLKKQIENSEVDAAAAMAPLVVMKAPHEVVQSAGLGWRAAEGAQVALSTENLEDVESGVKALKQVLVDEQARIHRAARKENPQNVSAGDASEKGNVDALRLRLTLVPALLQTRREADANKEAEICAKLHPGSCAAALWHAKCLFRLGKRKEGKNQLEYCLNLINSGSEQGGADAYWAVTEAREKLQAVKEMERGERRAKDTYARGLFSEAAKFYDDATAAAAKVGDDKWSRAELHANRAACYRRARDLKQSIKDLEVSLSLFPCYKRALFRMGVIRLENGEPDVAVKMFETLCGLDREWPNVLDWLVKAHAAVRRNAGPCSYIHEEPQDSQPGLGANFQNREGWATAAGERDIATEKNHYTVLGVSTDATEKQLKKAYRVMSLKYHPDKEGGSTRAFQRIATAYQTLNDPDKRQQYDDGADIGQKKDDDDSDEDDERKKQSIREEIERKYFPERYAFWPFGDPFVEKRKREERKRQRQGKKAWYEEDI